LRHFAAGRAHDVWTLVFGDMGFDRRQLRHLMTPRLTRHRPAARRQPAVTMATRVRQEFDDVIDALERDQRPTMSGMSWLTARLPPTLRAPASDALAAGESIGGRWF